ncbi:pre-mRNA-splicing factor SLU7-like isoform X2 [Babylonia areolata]
MSFQLNMPPSEIGRLARSEQSAGGGERQKQSREDWKKMKELEEARKAGTAPAMQDEEGKDINPHIPQYIMQAPWYFGAKTATLRHQRPQEERYTTYSQLDDHIKRGIKAGAVATKYRKGACENCGAITHKKKDCLERPRKIGARFTGDSIAPDEFIPNDLVQDFEGKRDIWTGFDPKEHQRKLFEEYGKMEEAKRVMKEEALEKNLMAKLNEAKEKGGDDEDKYAEDMDMPGQKFETKNRITVRNLRIREDTAKYLYNLDLNSAYYDPKTRSMRQNPLAGTGKESMLSQYSGDNFVRFSGEAEEFAKKQLFAWEAYEKGTDVHLQADPTKLELLSREFHNRRDQFKKSAKESVLDHYGGQEHLEAPPRQLLLAQTEDYVEYSRHGTVIKGQEKARVKSRYEEDIHPNNHTSVWGSYWKNGMWGFQCCHSLIKESYCTGEAGKTAQEESGVVLAAQDAAGTAAASSALRQTAPPDQEEQHKSKEKKKKKKSKKRKKKHKKKKDSSDSDSEESDSESEERKRKKLKKALDAETAHQQKMSELMAMDERKRPYNSMYDVKAPTEEELEAFRMKQIRDDDPMAAFLSK